MPEAAVPAGDWPCLDMPHEVPTYNGAQKPCDSVADCQDTSQRLRPDAEMLEKIIHFVTHNLASDEFDTLQKRLDAGEDIEVAMDGSMYWVNKDLLVPACRSRKKGSSSDHTSKLQESEASKASGKEPVSEEASQVQSNHTSKLHESEARKASSKEPVGEEASQAQSNHASQLQEASTAGKQDAGEEASQVQHRQKRAEKMLLSPHVSIDKARRFLKRDPSDPRSPQALSAKALPGSRAAKPSPASQSFPSHSPHSPEEGETMLSFSAVEIIERILEGKKTLEIRHRNIKPGTYRMCCQKVIYGQVDIKEGFEIESDQAWKAMLSMHLWDVSQRPYKTTVAHPVHNVVRYDQPFLFAKKHGPMGLVKFYPVKPDDATKPANTSPKKATSPEPITDPNGEDEKTIEDTIEAPEDGNMWVMKLPGTVARILLATPDHEQQAFILPWGRASLRKGTDVCIVEQGRNGHVLGFARLEQVLRIKAYADLKDYPCFQMYDAAQKKAFRDHLQSKKSLFVWIMKEAKVAGASLLLPKMKGPGQFCKRTALQEASDAIVPDMRLASTAEYFVKKMSVQDREALAARMKQLDGVTIKIGSTCSGTDICVPVMKQTFKKLSAMFGVNVQVEHIFSVEYVGIKRSFIAEAHHDPSKGSQPPFHIFKDVGNFAAGRGHCFTCGKDWSRGVTEREREREMCVYTDIHILIFRVQVPHRRPWTPKIFYLLVFQ